MVRKPKGYIHQSMYTAIYIKTYADLLNLINGLNIWLKTSYPPLLPPIVKRQLGRPKKKRIRDVYKVQNPFKISKKNSVMTYRICKEKGPNMRICKNVVKAQNKSNIKNKGCNNNIDSSSNKKKRKVKVDGKSTSSRLRNKTIKMPVCLLVFFIIYK